MTVHTFYSHNDDTTGSYLIPDADTIRDRDEGVAQYSPLTCWYDYIDGNTVMTHSDMMSRPDILIWPMMIPVECDDHHFLYTTLPTDSFRYSCDDTEYFPTFYCHCYSFWLILMPTNVIPVQYVAIYDLHSWWRWWRYSFPIGPRNFFPWPYWPDIWLTDWRSQWAYIPIPHPHTGGRPTFCPIPGPANRDEKPMIRLRLTHSTCCSDWWWPVLLFFGYRILIPNSPVR